VRVGEKRRSGGREGRLVGELEGMEDKLVSSQTLGVFVPPSTR